MLIKDHNLIEIVSVEDKGGFVPDAQGYLNVSARISRTGVQTYAGAEIPGGHFIDQPTVHIFRPASEVFSDASIASFENLPITAGHPDTGVDASNYKELSVGVALGKPVRDGDFLKVKLSIRDADTVSAIINNGGMQISNGYTVDLDTTAGTTTDGDKYDAIQRNIRGNHIALVDAARCGPECRIGDSQVSDCGCASCQKQKGSMMTQSTVRVTVDGMTIDMTEQGKQALEKLQAQLADRDNTINELNTTIATKDGEIETRDSTISEKDGEITALKAEKLDDAAIDARVKARGALVDSAKAIIGDTADFTDKSDAEVKKMAVAHKYGDEILADADEAAINGMFKIAKADAGADPLSDALPTNTQKTNDAAYLARVDRLSQNWKGK